MKVQLLIIGSTLLALTGVGQVKQSNRYGTNMENAKASDYFLTNLKPGMRMGTMFMRTISVTGTDFNSQVNRVSGTGDYTVKSANADSSSFDALFTVDGYPPTLSKIVISDSGKTIGFSGKRLPNREASGLVYNPAIWGTCKSFPKKGDTWDVVLDHAWELGGPGKQTVTVIFADPKSATIILKREGSGDGLYDGEPAEMKIKKSDDVIKVKVTAGKGHWTGYTTIRQGLVLSDELMAIRPLTLVSDNATFNAMHREYIMLNSTLLP